MTEVATQADAGLPLAPVENVDLAPLGVLEPAEVEDLVLDGTGRVEFDGRRLVGASAAEATVWVVFTRHRITCPGGVDPTVCGCAPRDDHFHAYLAGSRTDGAVPFREAS